MANADRTRLQNKIDRAWRTANTKAKATNWKRQKSAARDPREQRLCVPIVCVAAYRGDILIAPSRRKLVFL